MLLAQFTLSGGLGLLCPFPVNIVQGSVDSCTEIPTPKPPEEDSWQDTIPFSIPKLLGLSLQAE